MPLQLEKVHEYKKVPGQPNAILMRSNPYIRLCEGDGPPIFIQKGQFYSEGGGLLHENDLPGWFKGELSKVSDAAMREAGLAAPEADPGQALSDQLVLNGLDPAMVELLKDPDVQETLEKLLAIKMGMPNEPEEVEPSPDPEEDPDLVEPGDPNDPDSLDYEPDPEDEEKTKDPELDAILDDMIGDDERIEAEKEEPVREE